MDVVTAYMQLKKMGEVIHSSTCTGPSVKKCKNKLALMILCQMHGPDKKWKELQNEAQQNVLKCREQRNAGEKPVLRQYDPDYLVEGQQSSQDFNDDSEEENRAENLKKRILKNKEKQLALDFKDQVKLSSSKKAVASTS